MSSVDNAETFVQHQNQSPGQAKGQQKAVEQNKEIEDMLRRALDGERRTCANCGHMEVCTVFRALTPLLGQNFSDKTRPFNAEDVGYVCRKWFPVSVLKTLNGDVSQ